MGRKASRTWSCKDALLLRGQEETKRGAGKAGEGAGGGEGAEGVFKIDASDGEALIQ